jgi:hypothetical protein
VNIGNFFRNTDADTKPCIIVPAIYDIRHTAVPAIAEKVKRQIETAGTQLVNHFWKWNRRMLRATPVQWSESDRKFLDLDIRCFQEHLMRNFRICTTDQREWALDRCIAAMIWEFLTSDRSPLQLADWNLELTKRMEAERRKERHAVK